MSDQFSKHLNIFHRVFAFQAFRSTPWTHNPLQLMMWPGIQKNCCWLSRASRNMRGNAETLVWLNFLGYQGLPDLGLIFYPPFCTNRDFSTKLPLLLFSCIFKLNNNVLQQNAAFKSAVGSYLIKPVWLLISYKYSLILKIR